MNTKHKYYLQIPLEIVRGENYGLDARTFVVYAFLLYKEFKQFKKGEKLIIDHVTMKAAVQIFDNRALKKCFLKLHQHGLIEEIVDKFPSNGYLNITLKKPFEKQYFTQLPVALFNRLPEIGHIGFRLLYYYEGYINRKEVQKSFSRPPYDLIRAHTLLSTDTITKYNNILSDLNLLKVSKHQVELNVDLDKDRFMKWNNHYHVLLQNI